MEGVCKNWSRKAVKVWLWTCSNVGSCFACEGNSGLDEKARNQTEKGCVMENTGEVSSERLKSFILRIEKLEESRQSVVEDIKDVYLEIKSQGFDAKIVRQLVNLRKLEVEKRREAEELLELYKAALGMDA